MIIMVITAGYSLIMTALFEVLGVLMTLVMIQQVTGSLSAVLL